MAGALAWLAPSGWSSGPAIIEVSYRDDVVVDVPVVLGSPDPVSASAESGQVQFGVTAAGGLELSGRIDIEIEIDDATRHEPVALEEVAVTIVSENGEREVVPVLSAELGTLHAGRTPPDNTAVVLAVLGLAMVLWVTEAVPLFVTSLTIPVVLAVADVGSAKEVLAPFFDPIIVLFFSGFLMAEGMRRVRLDRLIAVTIVDIAGKGAVRLYGAFVGLAAFLSMWMSNTAAVSVLLPIALTVTEPLKSVSYRKVVVLGVAYAATIGGVGSAIGTPANPLAISFIESLTGREISFAEWFGFGLPMVVVFVPIMAWYLWRVSRVDVSIERLDEAALVAHEQRRVAGPLTRPQVEVLGVFLTVMAFWLTQTVHGVNTGIVALGGAIAMFVLGHVESEDVSRISWPTLLTFGGGLTLGTFMGTTGTSDWLVTKLGIVTSWPDILAVAGVAVFALALTTVASNTAAAATLIPLAVPLAWIIGADPVLLVVVVAIASSVDFALVIGTPPTMLAFDTKLFTVREILLKGMPLDAIGLAVLIVAVVPVWSAFGLV